MLIFYWGLNMVLHSKIFAAPKTAELLTTINSALFDIENHRVCRLIHTVEDFRTFMSWHVFAVWSFMSIVKRLQFEFTSISIPWIPPRSTAAARLVNEIVLEGETGIAPDGRCLSHFELYLSAMEEIGADTFSIKVFVDLVAANMSIEDALKIANVPSAVQKLVIENIHVAASGSVEEVLGSFVYGREHTIPRIFQCFLSNWEIEKSVIPKFIFYLQHHIYFDTDEYRSIAMKLLTEQVNNNEMRFNMSLNSALAAIEQRIYFLEALACQLECGSISKIVKPCKKHSKL